MGASPVDYIVETKGRTPEQVWNDLRGQAGYESGHEYSGDLGSKHEYAIFARLPDAGVEVLQAIATMTSYGDEDDQPRERFPLTTTCPAHCWSELSKRYGRVVVKVMAHVREVVGGSDPTTKQWLPSKYLRGSVEAWVERDCRRCKGTGKVPLEGEALADMKKRKAAYERSMKMLEGFPKKRFQLAYDDKWGPAVMVIGKEHTYVGGYCPS